MMQNNINKKNRLSTTDRKERRAILDVSTGISNAYLEAVASGETVTIAEGTRVYQVTGDKKVQTEIELSPEIAVKKGTILKLKDI